MNRARSDAAKRLFDLALALPALALALPLMVAITLWVRLDSAGPALFRQQRVGRHGRLFHIHKFRTMRVRSSQAGPLITVAGDARVTRAGRWLRRTKLDELPQLLDVIRGDMSLVGPRPEVPRYMALYPDEARRLILSVRPGVTDRATIEFRDEERLLAAASDPERAYVEQVMPIKQRYYLDYVARRSLAGDVGILIDTLRAVLGRADS
ncbi:MAG TPA: sugar transferase [Ottowia sp.]|jgi:lipopolysaccharide/colanic/teichoic acid biosynthesis glycosyltransferase|nr:sugar transferase [Ottowia sp.]OJV59417.1 MAG: sugar transferase [Burkholderiales bacterium 68-10]HMT16587.1 sugar transferase [Ottowia sp.]HMT82196.1 sugar transferase [Ottowia sp.]HOK11987.1 sugar transferase [Ottowia sp.]